MITTVVAGVATAVLAAVIIGGLTGTSHGAKLRALDPIVENGAGAFEPTGQLNQARQTDASKARVEIRLENNGDRQAVLTSAVFTIRKLIEVGLCGLGGELPVSAGYDVTLPGRVGEWVEIPFNQQLKPDEADRFVFRVGEPDQLFREGTIGIYQVDVSVQHDGDKTPLSVGRVVLALPYVQPEMFQFTRAIPPATACVPGSRARFQPVMQLGGVRSQQLQTALAQLH